MESKRDKKQKAEDKKVKKEKLEEMGSLVAPYSLKMVDVGLLKPADYNPRVDLSPGDKEYEDIKASVKKHKFATPLTVNMFKGREYVIIGGHQRLKVAIDLGYKEVPCYMISVDIENERELNVRLNKNSGSWDWSVLVNKFDLVDLTNWGFTQEELAGYTPSGNLEPEDLPSHDLDIEEEESNRFILVYTSKTEKDYLMALLNIDGKNVIYTVDELKKGRPLEDGQF